MSNNDLSDDQWQKIAPLLPPERGRRARPALDNRQYLNGILDVLKRQCAWREMDGRYGKWNSVYVRFRRWNESGVWARVEPRITSMIERDDTIRPRHPTACMINQDQMTKRSGNA